MKLLLGLILSGSIGGIAGYLYYRFFGCSGSCPITSSPWATSALMAVVGVLLFLSFVEGKAR